MGIVLKEKAPNPTLAKGYSIAITAMVIWSFTAIFIRYLTEYYHLPALVLAFWRDAFATFGLASFLGIKCRKLLRIGKSSLIFFSQYGFVLALFNATWTVSVAQNGAAVATMLAYSSVAFTAVIGNRLYGERLGKYKISAVILSMIGALFVSGAYDITNWRIDALGVSSGLVSGLAFGGYSLMGKAASNRSINPWTTMTYTFGWAAVYLLLFNLIFPESNDLGRIGSLFWLNGSWIGWLILLVLAVGPTIGGYGLFTVSLTYLPASVAQLIATLEPLFTAVLAYLLLDERFSITQLIGGVFIICGVVIILLRQELNGR